MVPYSYKDEEKLKSKGHSHITSPRNKKKLNSHGGKTEGGGRPASHVAKEHAAKMDAAILF